MAQTNRQDEFPNKGAFGEIAEDIFKSYTHNQNNATTNMKISPHNNQNAQSDDVDEHEERSGISLHVKENQKSNQDKNSNSQEAKVVKTILDDIDAYSAPLHSEMTPIMDENNDCLVTEVNKGEDDQMKLEKENVSVPDNIFLPPMQSSPMNVSKSKESPEKDLREQKPREVPRAKEDPFSLSADEEFSPKVYKPVLKRFSSFREKSTFDLKRPISDMRGDNTEGSDDKATNNCVLPEPDIVNCIPERKKLKSSPRVFYVHSPEMIQKANKLFRIKGRANLVHSLIQVYGILHYIEVLEPRHATECEILGFHCPDYIKCLKGISDDDDDNSEAVIDEAEEYGLSYDCPLQKDCFDIASLISGGTIAAAEALCDGRAEIAINWCGGWHHAKRDSASGFCYLNDIVLGILKLREHFEKVLYIDIDLHHGDGVEEAFCLTPKVMTVSFHKFAPGFFPGSGNVEDIGTGRGKYFCLNVPLMDGIKDQEFYFVFASVMKSIKEKFHPEAVVMQCGADTLADDPMLSFNLTHIAIAKCICLILTWNLPTLLLGGGGYHFANTAKCWTFITAMAAGKKLPVDIPEHEHLPEYGPSYELTTSQGYRKNCNSKEYLRQLLVKVHRNLNKLDTTESSHKLPQWRSTPSILAKT